MKVVGSMDPWSSSLESLQRWHAASDREALVVALRFLSGALPGLLSPRLARRLGDETVRDIVQQFLLDLQARPLPSTPEHPRTYLGRALQNRALSLLRRKGAVPGIAVPDDPPLEHSLPAQERQVAARQVLRALQSLPMEDRVALKLSETPEFLDDDELDWLASRAGIPREEVRARGLRAKRTEERVRIFEGVTEPFAESEVGRAVDRFHKRVSRARQKLLERIGGER